VGDTESLKKYVEKEKESGVTLSTIGFGTGNYNDDLMEQIADIGNGNYSYIDNYNEAVKVLATELTSLLEVIAKDVKIQIEFNPEIVSHYKLIGYENRILKKEDFNNDKVDAGEIGSGHSVTALYEIVFTDSKNKPVDELRYAKGGNDKVDYSKEFGLLKLRFKEPNGDKSTLVEFPMFKKDVKSEMKETSTNFKFSLAVAAFGMLLKNSKDLGSVSFDDVISLAKESKSNDEFGYREEFIKLVEKYKNIK
jgi:Ca-activated chloride channel family protein